MIIDNIQNREFYYSIHPCLTKAFSFLLETDFSKPVIGRNEIDGDIVFALVSKGTATGKAGKLEAHKKYLDLHFVVSGLDKMGYKPIEKCKHIESEYDEPGDYMLFNDIYDSFFILNPGDFAICFPQDTHVPLQGEDDYYKVVIKIKI
jgi:biofilm protein TabA